MWRIANLKNSKCLEKFAKYFSEAIVLVLVVITSPQVYAVTTC